MTAPLDEKGLLPCPFCGAQANSHQVRARSVRFVCPDCEASGPIADGNPEQEQVWGDARIAWNRRAYLAASPSPSEMEFTHVAKTKLDGLLADGWQVNGYSIQKDDRIGLVTTGAFVGWYSNACEAMNTAEAQVLRLTEENEALRKERTSLIETKREQIDRLTADRDHNAAEYEKVLNSYADENQCFSDKLEAAEARSNALEEALRETKAALLAAEERDNHARFRANSPREDAEVKHLRTSAIRRARTTLQKEQADE